MKFGIFYELQLPRPWVAGDELKLYQNALSQMELADKLGYDHAWVVEHHFLEEYSHSPSPESFLAAASQRTKNIRLGHGILQLTTNHPARVAERVAVLDLLSNGRCEFGMGESASITELTPFGRDMETKKEVFEEAVQAIFPMFKDAGSEHHGKYFDIPLRNVVPKPCRSRIRRCGWPARSCRPSNAPAVTALARSASSSSAPMPRMPGCTPITTR
ncbi:alkanesulfonate monooxygenase SsuD/methylene tetrahydromethanopterin reductase-like flavin-dependent oxidoreductase (luciferase family) [Bradyrhizobium barranii subsp. barranii]